MSLIFLDKALSTVIIFMYRLQKIRRNWPARSPDLTPLDFFLCGHVKNLVYRVPVNNLDTLRNRIRDAMAMVTPEMLQNVRSNLLKRARLCIPAGGGRFEHLL
jgi:hypothetical protein